MPFYTVKLETSSRKLDNQSFTHQLNSKWWTSVSLVLVSSWFEDFWSFCWKKKPRLYTGWTNSKLYLDTSQFWAVSQKLAKGNPWNRCPLYPKRKDMQLSYSCMISWSCFEEDSIHKWKKFLSQNCRNFLSCGVNTLWCNAHSTVAINTVALIGIQLSSDSLMSDAIDVQVCKERNLSSCSRWTEQAICPTVSRSLMKRGNKAARSEDNRERGKVARSDITQFVH